MRTFEAFTAGALNFRNRLLMAPIKTAFANSEGGVTPRLVNYYRRRAHGGVGAIIVESMNVDPRGREHPKQLSITSDAQVDGLRTLTASIHEEGAIAIAHLNHAGRAANPKVTGTAPEAPSAIACPTTGAVPQEMSSDRIQEIVDAYAAAAGRAVQAGFDAIELQFGLGYLIHQFYSSLTNMREDKYGGTLKGRLRFGAQILSAILEVTGRYTPIVARISAATDASGGDHKESVTLAKCLKKRGVSALHVASGSACDSPPWYYQHMRLPARQNLDWAKSIKREVGIPVIVAGRMGDPELIRDVLTRGEVDGVALGRPLVVDPDFPLKMEQGKDDTIIRCGACMQGCLVGVKSGRGLGCVANPEVGREGEVFETEAAPGKIVVVGGGPAGIQAAISAANRNHEVVLFEEKGLGGQFNLAVMPPGKEEMKKPLHGLIQQLQRENITVKTGIHADLATILAEEPQHVILATGSTTRIPSFPGMKSYLVSEEVLMNSEPVGQYVLVIGGGMVGLETAETLVSRHHKVTVVEILDDVALDMEPITRTMVLKYLENNETRILKGTRIIEIDNGLVIVEHDGFTEELGPFDTFVVATGVLPRNALAAELKSHAVPYTLAGDAREPGNIVNAVLDGRNAAYSI